MRFCIEGTLVTLASTDVDTAVDFNYDEENIFNRKLVQNHYFTYLETKPWQRSCLLLIPIIGNILIYNRDMKNQKKRNYSGK